MAESGDNVGWAEYMQLPSDVRKAMRRFWKSFFGDAEPDYQWLLAMAKQFRAGPSAPVRMPTQVVVVPPEMEHLRAAVECYDALENAYNIAEKLYMEVHKPQLPSDRMAAYAAPAPTQWHKVVDSLGYALGEVEDEVLSLARKACQANQPPKEGP